MALFSTHPRKNQHIAIAIEKRLQNDLHEELNAQSGRSALSVKVGNCGQLRCGWFVRRYDSSWRYQGIPLKVHDKISEAKKGEGRLLEIILGKGEDYFVEWLK